MKIATYNINNINARLPNLLRWLRSAKPDIVCLQELKAEQSRFPEEALAELGYRAAWVGQKSWNGVALLARQGEIVVTRRALPGDAADKQARYLEAAIGGLIVSCLYAPNGNPQPGPKFDYKIAWMKRLHKHAAKLLKSKAPVVLAGDFNVAPSDLDIYPTTSWIKDALVQPEPRAAYGCLLEQGWMDALREQYGKKRVYTFWTYWRNRFANDHGLRIDHLLLSPKLATRLKEAGVDRATRAQPRASDHAPAWITLSNG
jgi:exodeoxyribonuclease-3